MPAIPFNTVKKILPADKQQGIIDSVFGKEMSPIQAAEAARNASFQDWINSRKSALEKQQSSDARMARVQALGNILTTMVQPIGWAIGGGGSGVTGGVQPYDNRQYLEAFNRAVKASDDLRNLESMQGEYNFKIAEENYQREKAREDEERRNKQNLDYYRARADIEENKQKNVANAKYENDMQKLERTYELKKDLAGFTAKYRVTKGGMTVDERMLLEEKRQYEDFKNFQMRKGEKPITFEQYLAGVGYDVSSVGGVDAVKPQKTPKEAKESKEKTPPTKRKKSSGAADASKVPPSKRK